MNFLDYDVNCFIKPTEFFADFASKSWQNWTCKTDKIPDMISAQVVALILFSFKVYGDSQIAGIF